MSFTDEYLAQKKKKKEQTAKKVKSTGSSFTDEYLSKKSASSSATKEKDIAPLYVNKTAALFGDIAPITKTKATTTVSTKKDDDEDERKWFQKGAFEDGYQFGDVFKTILGTTTDVMENVGAGILGMGEKAADAIAYVSPLIAQGQFYQNGGAYQSLQTQKLFNESIEEGKKWSADFIKKDLYDEEKIAKKIVLGTDKNSVLGEKSDALLQSGGQLLATAGLQAVGVPWFLTTGATSFGSQAEIAMNDGAGYEEAGLSAAVSAGAEILTEKLSGGIKFGDKTLDDMWLKPLTEKIANKAVKTLVDLGVDAVGEGAEEVVSGVFSNLGTAIYKEDSLDELLSSEEAVDEYIESFIGGAVLGGLGSGVQAIRDNKRIHLTENEKKVVEHETQKRTEGKTLTTKEENKIRNEVVWDMLRGYISTDTIEEVLGGETYQSWKNTVDSEDALQREYDELGKKQNATLAETTRYNELYQQLNELKTTSQRNALKDQLGTEVMGLVQNERLAESYNERSRRGRAYEADLTKYDAKQQATIQKAIDSGILNNTNRTHEFVDMIAKITADKGVLFDFTNNEKLKESGFAVDGKAVNGYVTKDGVTLNIDSAKNMNSVVGHEITHVLEGTELYDTLKQVVAEYATTKGDYQGRYDALAKLYEGVEGADIDAELTADLVGDYLFTDTEFVRNLSVQHRNVFQKIYDEIKYLYKVATAGSKEARELEKVKRAFEEAYKADGKAQTETKYSVSDKNIKDYSTGYASNEYYFTMAYSQDGKVVGTLNYGEYNGNPNVKMIEVEPEYRRQGIGKKLLQELQRKYPETEIDFGMSTPDGTKLLDAITYTQTDEQVVEGKRKLRAAQTELVDVERRLNELYDLDELTAEQEQEVQRLGERWDQLYYTDIRNLTEEYGDKRESKRFVKLDDTKYSLTDTEGVELASEQQEYFKNSVVRDANGNLKRMYHGTSNGGFTVFDTYGSNHGLFGQGSYFTDDPLVGLSYTEKGKGNNPDLYEVYLNITNPMNMDATADAEAWREAFPDAEFPESGTNEQFYRAMEQYFADEMYEKWEAASYAVEAIQGMGFDGITHIGGGRFNKQDTNRHQVYIAFEPEQIKKFNNKQPTENPDIRYSLSDSDGKQLTKEQQEYFKDSKVRDENGSLKVMYHGSRDAGFHVFDAKMSDDNTSFFFVDRNDVAASYSGTTETYEAKTIRTVEDMNNFLAEIGYDHYEAVERNGRYELLENNEYVTAKDTMQEIYEEFCWYEGVGDGDANYKVYLNLTNPLEVDAEGRNWNRINREFSQEIYDLYQTLTDEEKNALMQLASWEDFGIFRDEWEHAGLMRPGIEKSLISAYPKLDGADVYDLFTIASDGFNPETIKENANGWLNTRTYSQKAKAQGYDGVIFKNIVDVGGYGNGSEGAATVAIAFDSNQIKSTGNVKPTKDADIRYSLSEDSEGREISPAVQKRFGNSKVVDENGSLKVVYHGTATGEFSIFDKSKGSVEGDFGSGFYFTDNEADVAEHYEGGGPDFDNKVARLAVQIEAEEEIDYEEAEQKAREQLYKGSHKFEVYLNIENPAIVGETMLLDGESYMEQYNEDDFDDYDEYLAEMEQLVADDIENVVWEVERNVDIYSTDGIADVLWDAYSNGGMDIEEMKSRLNDLYLEDNEGNFVANEVARQIIESLGYDGIIDPTVSGKWNMDIEEGTTHYIVFKPNQIKAITNQNPTDNPDIHRSLSNIGEEANADSLSALKLEAASVQEEAVSEMETVAENAMVEENLFPDDLGPVPDDPARFDSLDDADVPPVRVSEAGEQASPVTMTRDAVSTIAQTVTDNLYVGNRQVGSVHKLISEYAKQEFPDKNWLFQQLKDNYGKHTEKYADETTQEVKNTLRKYRLNVSDEIKGDIADYNDLRRHNFGKVLFSRQGMAVDSAYEELSAMYPGFFPSEIINPTDQLLQIVNVANMDATTEQTYEIDDDDIWDVTNDIAEMVSDYQHIRSEKAAQKPMEKGSVDDLVKNAERYAPMDNKRAAFDAPVAEQALAPTYDAQPKKGVADGQQTFVREEPVTEEERTQTRKQLHQGIVDSVKATFKAKGLNFDKVLKNAKDLSTLATVDNTPQRVMEKALGYKEGQILSDLTVNKVAQNETEGIKWLNKQVETIKKISKQYGIKPGSKQSAAAQMYAEGFYVAENNDIIKYGDAELAKDFPDIKMQRNIKRLANDPRIRQIYDETLAAINASRTRNAYPEIPRLKNYFLHFRAMEDTFSRLGLPFNPNDIRAKDLPTDLNGVTADLKPGQPYFASANHRRGKRTSFDMLGGLERYLNSAKNQIYHIDDIQTLRALRNYIAETYGQAVGLENLDTLTNEEAQERIEQIYDAHLSTFAKFLNEEANVIAGKTALIDRGLEGMIGRRGMTFMNTLNGQVGSNMVGFNISSSLTNFLPVAQTFAKTNKFDFTKAFAQTVANKLSGGRLDNFAKESPVIIRRKGGDRFYRTPWQKVGDTGYVLMSAVDDISTEMIARTKYNEFIRKGMEPQKAHLETDKWVSRLMGDRSLGQMPQLYNSKMLGLVTKFQLEVRNQLDSQFYDTIQETEASSEHIKNGLARNAVIAAKIASTFTQLAVVQHLYGTMFEKVAGYNPAFDIIEVLMTAFGYDDEEDSEDTTLDNLAQALLTLAEDLPYTSVVLDGGRVPMSSAIPDVASVLRGEDEYGNEIGVVKALTEEVKEIAPYYLMPGGYGQLKKTKAGLEMFSDEHPIAGSYTDSGNLRFPVEDAPIDKIKAAIFGQYASENARKYFDGEERTLNPDQTKIFAELDMPIEDYWDHRDKLYEFYEHKDAMYETAKADGATDNDVLKSKYINGVYSEINELYAEQKELADGNSFNKSGKIKELQEQIAELIEEGLRSDNVVSFEDGYREGGEYARVNGKLYKKNDEGEWWGLSDEQVTKYEVTKAAGDANYATDGTHHYKWYEPGPDASKDAYPGWMKISEKELERQEEVTSGLGISPETYWSNPSEYRFAYDNPENYAVAKAVGGYEAYKGYTGDLYDIKADKDENGKSISGSRKEKVLDYINNLDADYYTRIILWKSEYNSDDSYNVEIIDYLNGRDDLSFADRVTILRKLGFDVTDDGDISW